MSRKMPEVVAARTSLIASCLLLAASAARGAGITGDAIRGKNLYQACSACHSIDDNDLGPKHRGVVGRPAASVVDYAYSKALRESGLTWDESTLDRWLTNPSALVPGTKMFFKLDDPQSRADVIAYLKELR
jgi:cytochrome c